MPWQGITLAGLSVSTTTLVMLLTVLLHTGLNGAVSMFVQQ